MDTPNTIVVPTDFSEHSRVAFPHAGALAQAWGARIVLVYVIPPSAYPTYHVVRVKGFPNLSDEMRKAALGQLQRLANEFGEGLEVSVECREGRVFREVEVVATERGAGLIVIATHGRGGIGHAVLGSNAERIVRTSPVPVLSVHAAEVNAPLDPTVVRRILLPTDFTDTSRRARDLAGWFASPSTEIVATHVFEPPTSPLSPLAILGRDDVGQVEPALRKQADADMKAWMTDLRAIHPNARHTIVEGSPADQLVRVARQEDADLIAIATHGHTGLEHMYLGSVTEKVVCKAGCPVLTVREDVGSPKA